MGVRLYHIYQNDNEGERMIKGIAMAQWVDCLRNKILANPLPLLLSCEISGALHLVQLVLMACGLAGRVNFENLKI